MEKYNQEDVMKALKTGISRGKKARTRTRAIKGSLSMFSLLLISFTILVNVSGTFADSLIDIPIIGDIVEMVHIGSKYEEVAERGYFEQGDVLYSDDEITVALIAYYYSDNEINMYLKIESDDKHYSVRHVELLDQEGKMVSGGSYSYGDLNDEGITNIEIDMIETDLPEHITISFDVRIDEEDRTFKAELDKKVSDLVKIDIDQSFEVDDMIIHIHNMEITPTSLNLRLDVLSETMMFYDFNNIYIQTDQNKYPRISNGLIRSGSMETGMTYFFKTPFFDEYESIEIVIEGADALPVENSTIIIDLDKEEMIKQIDDKLVFLGVVNNRLAFEGVEDGISFSSYDGHYFSEKSYMTGEQNQRFELKIDRSLVDNMIEIDFSDYTNLIPFKEIIKVR